MQFRVVSQQLSLDEAEVSFARDFASAGALPRALSTVRLKLNETEDLPNVAPGEIQLLCTNCVVRSRRSDVTYRIPALRLTTLITDEDIVAGVAQVIVGFHGFARVEVVDLNDEPLVREHVLGVALPSMSIEVKGPEGSPLHVLLPPGEYMAYLAGSRPVQVRFVVREHEEDAGTIRLRDSPNSDGQT
jgi:hypothetical protein